MDVVKYLPKLFNTVVSTEYITFIAAIFLLIKKRIGIWRLFLPFLFLIVCVETLGWYQSWVLKEKVNGLIFNFNLIVNICFSAWVILHAEPLLKIKKVLGALLLFFLLFAATNLFFFQGLNDYNSATEVLGDVLCLTLSCVFFYYSLKEETYRDLFHYEYFWYANGMLFYSIGAVVLYIYYSFLRNLQAKGIEVGGKVYFTVNSILNILLYGSYIIAFICRNRNTKSSLPS